MKDLVRGTEYQSIKNCVGDSYLRVLKTFNSRIVSDMFLKACTQVASTEIEEEIMLKLNKGLLA
jgi:hypothetical protein